LHHFY